MQIEIKCLSKDSIDCQIEVYRRSFDSDENKDVLYRRWEEKHYQNPIGDSLIFGAYHDNKLIGINAFQPCLYQYHNLKLYVLQSCESGVLPEYRGEGIWTKIMLYSMDYIRNNTAYTVLIGFPNYRNSFQGFIKLGWRHLFNMDNYLLVNNVNKFANIVSSNICVRILSKLTIIHKFLLSIYSLSSYEITECEISELLWSDDNSEVTLINSDKIVQYKIRYKNSSILKIQYKGVKVATVIYEKKMYKDSEIILIDKITTDISNTRCSEKGILASLCNYIFKKHKDVVYIRFWTQNDDILKSNLKKLLSIRAPHLNPFITYCVKDETLTDDWSLSFWNLD